MTDSSPQPGPESSTHAKHFVDDGPSHHALFSGRGLLFNLVIPLALLCVAGFIVFLLGDVEPEERTADDTTRAGRLQALPPVRVESLRSLESTGEQLRLEVDGTVVPFREARLAAEIAGRVISKSDRCEAGSFVREGEVLMKIDPTDYELEVQRLTRLQEQEYEALGEVDQEMRNTKRLIDVAAEDVALQQKEVDRQMALPDQFASRAEIDQAKRALLASTQQMVSVENQLDLLRKRRVRLEASERLAATQLKAAEVNLARTEIRAPIDGVIVREDADLNTFVARGNMLLTIEDTSKVEVSTNLRMDQLYWVLDQPGGNGEASSRGYDLPETPAIVEYQLSGRDDVVYRWQGRLLRYDGIGLDPVTRTVPVRVVVDNPLEYVDQEGNVQRGEGATALVRGMYVQVQLLIQPKTPLVVIPARALQPGNRVFQFVPDESVLGGATLDVVHSSDAGTVNQPSPPAESHPADSPKPSPEQAAGGKETVGSQGKFDPTQWEPGRVIVRQAVNPVDSLTLDHPVSEVGDAELTGPNRMWVCEVRDAALAGGAYVVVSPMGSVDDVALPVRADRNGIVGDRDQAMPGTATSTATTEFGNPEDAS